MKYESEMNTVDLHRLRQKMAQISEILNETYGTPRWRQHYPPIDELVLTILSQSTTDSNSLAAFESLKARFPDWHELLEAPVSEVVSAIRTAGLANQKAPRIQNALRFVVKEIGELSLDHLRDMTPLEAKDWLCQIKGVGYKTASIILLFSLGMPAYPVDTHVHRVAGRLGVIPEKMNAEKAHFLLEEIVPRDDYYASHLQLIQHGREVCHARNPECEKCPLWNECVYSDKLAIVR